MVWKPHESESVTKDFLVCCLSVWEAGTEFPYVITERPAEVAIGMIDARRHGTTIDLGYVLARSHWGKGFMPAAVSELSKGVL